MPLTSTNKDIVRQWVSDVMNQAHLARIDQLATPAYGTEYRQRRERMQAAFADLHHSIEEIIAEDDKVTICWESKAIHVGNWRGVPSNMKQVSWRGITIYFIEDGKIAHEITSWNRLEMYEQLVGLPEWFQH